MRNPVSLYVHIPWCVRKCPYCDFNSHAIKQPIDEAAYRRALLDDLQQDLDEFGPRELHSIFFGGGTPSTLSPAFYSALLGELAQRLEFSADIEITLEANPGTVDAVNFSGYRQAGINRLSLGIQSFADDQLNRLGRIHDSRQARAAIDIAQQSGFDNINLDLMFALPGQTVKQALQDLQQAIDFAPSHLSWYQLTLEPNTEFASRPPTAMPDDELSWEIQQAGQLLLADNGFQQYEVSAYASEGRSCRHNLNYWSFGDYFGIGAGAHGKLTLPDGSALRLSKKRHPQDYQAGHYRSTQKRLQAEDLRIEFLMNALRLNAGFSPQQFSAATGLSAESLNPLNKKAINAGLLGFEQDRFVPTALGRHFLNNLLEAYL
ncbi:MAG: radical SAM family heme chaperone HemW [Chromatiales bacterium]